MNPNKKKSKFKEAKQALLSPFKHSTFHAIPNILQSENILVKLIWLFFFLIGITLCVLVTQQSVLT